MSTKKVNKNYVFCKKIASLRKEKHLTQSALAEHVGMTKQMISYLETRATNPTLEQIIKFADFFGVSTDDLIYKTCKKSGQSDLKSKLEKQLEQIKKLPTTKQKIISNMLEGAIKSE